MSQTSHIGIIGAGIIGLSCAFWLQRAGHKVTLIDREEPGRGASFGNAGLFADYARLPFARFSLMMKMPGMLMDQQSPLSMQYSYLPNLMPYGWRFAKACLPENYRRGRQALTQLQELARQADDILLQEAAANHLVKAEGCLGLFSSSEGFANAQTGELAERQQQGVQMQFLTADQVSELEPDIAGFHAGGVFYPETRFTTNPNALCQQLTEHFLANGGELIRDEVSFIHSQADNVKLQTTLHHFNFDQLVVAAGTASKQLLAQLDYKLPLVSERGYHLTLNSQQHQLTRPVGWLDKAVFLTPMQDGIRVAGTAEFANADAPPSHNIAEVMHGHANTMLGAEVEVQHSWVGSRPSTPDSLPVIGPLQQHPRVTLAFGHGHLGLTLAAITGQLVSQSVQQQSLTMPLDAFAPARFQ